MRPMSLQAPPLHGWCWPPSLVKGRSLEIAAMSLQAIQAPRSAVDMHREGKVTQGPGRCAPASFRVAKISLD